MTTTPQKLGRDEILARLLRTDADRHNFRSMDPEHLDFVLERTPDLWEDYGDQLTLTDVMCLLVGGA